MNGSQATSTCRNCGHDRYEHTYDDACWHEAGLGLCNCVGFQSIRTRVFQIGYRKNLVFWRSHILKLKGYEVSSVVGNEAAILALIDLPKHDVFIIGHEAPEQTRRDMVQWLRAKYPTTKILALHPPEYQPLLGVDHNALEHDPDEWLPWVAAATIEETKALESR